jgi:quinol monooxygenase YgiN
MTIGVTAKLQIRKGENQAFETLFKQFVTAVLANEAGCLLYALHQSRDDAQIYIVLEQYADEEALNTHSRTAHYQSFGKAMAVHLAAVPQIELMDSI